MLFNWKFAFYQFPMLFNRDWGLRSFGGDGRTDIWKFTSVSYRTSALWGRCPKRRKGGAKLEILTDRQYVITSLSIHERFFSLLGSKDLHGKLILLTLNLLEICLPDQDADLLSNAAMEYLEGSFSLQLEVIRVSQWITGNGSLHQKKTRRRTVFSYKKHS